MNRIPATVTGLESVESITVVSFDSGGTVLKMMALALNASVEPGKVVTLGVKASHVSLARNLDGELSISNRIPAVVESVEKGALLCSVTLRFGEASLESIITRDSAERMNLHPGDRLFALVKASDLSLLEISG